MKTRFTEIKDIRSQYRKKHSIKSSGCFLVDMLDIILVKNKLNQNELFCVYIPMCEQYSINYGYGKRKDNFGMIIKHGRYNQYLCMESESFKDKFNSADQNYNKMISDREFYILSTVLDDKEIKANNTMRL